MHLTRRAEWTAGAGLVRAAAQLVALARQARARPPLPLAVTGAAPVILVAVDTEHPDDERHPALRRATQALVAMNAEFRLMFVSAIEAAPLGEGERLEDTASGKHLEHRNRLRMWVAPLKLPQSRTSLHVVESADPAETLLDLARANHVDLIVVGAPGPSDRALAWWRSVASTVTANAPCSVHVVRIPEREHDGRDATAHHGQSADGGCVKRPCGAGRSVSAGRPSRSSRVRSTSARTAGRSSFFSRAPRCSPEAAPTRSSRVEQRSSRSVNVNARMPSASTIVSFMKALATRKFATSSSMEIGGAGAPAAAEFAAPAERPATAPAPCPPISSMYPSAASCASASAGAPISAICSRIGVDRLARIDEEQDGAQLALQRLAPIGDLVLSLRGPGDASVVHRGVCSGKRMVRSTALYAISEINSRASITRNDPARRRIKRPCA